MKGFLKILPKKTEKTKKLQNKFFKEKIIFFTLLFLALLAVFIFFDLSVKTYLTTYQIRQKLFSDYKTSDYPILTTSDDLNISAKGAMVMDDDSKVILYSKNPMLRFSMASTTKLMTALVALEHYRMDDILTVRTGKVDGSVVGFKEGERLSFEALLYAMFLPSANDAALAIAENYPGGKEEFIKKMNDKALELNLINMHFADSFGLADSENYTTVGDLANLASIATKNPIIAEIVATKTKTITNVDSSDIYSLNNLNILLGINGVNGIKTGYTDEAGGVLTTSVVMNEHKLIIVVMKSEDRFADTLTILRSLKDNLNYLSIHP